MKVVQTHPEYSELRKVLVEHYLEIEREKLNNPEARRRLDYEERLRNLKAEVTHVPIECREYYLHRPDHTGAIVILSGIQTTRRYWQKRIEEYQGVAGHLWVVAVFYSKPPAELTRQLKEAGFMPILLENLGPFLDKYLPEKGSQGLKSASPC